MEQINTQVKKGFTDFNLKYIAMILMVLDHIEYFFAFTGKVPVAFSWVGRLSAPLFLFCVIEGFVHTHDRKKYFMKVYSIAIVMGFIQFSFYNIGHRLVRPDGFFPQNEMLASFAILIVVLQGIDWCKNKKWIRGLVAILVPTVIWPIASVQLMMMVPKTGFWINLLWFSVLPMHSAIMDGGTSILVAGIVMYLTRKNRKIQAIGFCLVAVVFDIVIPFLSIPGLTISTFLLNGYQWVEMFSVFFMLRYNGERGHGSKKLFYWFYPVHVYVLYALSFLLYVVIK